MTKKTKTENATKEVVAAQTKNEISEKELLEQQVAHLNKSIAGLKATITERGRKIKNLEIELCTKKRVICEIEEKLSLHAQNCEIKDVELRKQKETIKLLQEQLYKERNKSIWERIFG